MARRPSPGRPAGKYTQAVRLFDLYRLLDTPAGIRVETLARELNVTPRSIRRDLAALRGSGQAIDAVDVDGERRVRLAQTAKTRDTVRLTKFQRLSLSAARRVFDVFGGTPLHDDLSEVFDKLTPPNANSKTEGAALAERFVFIPEAPKSYRKFKDQIYEVYDGVLRSLTLVFSYLGGSTPGLRKLQPYALVLYRNGLYVVGLDVVKKAPRTFAVERMRRVRALPQSPFVRDPTFDAAKLFDGAFGITGGGEPQTVVVDFEPRVATYVQERQWHSSQKISRINKGIRCELNVAIGEELVAWVLRWGASATVITPPELIERVRTEHLRAGEQYASSRGRSHDAAAGAV